MNSEHCQHEQKSQGSACCDADQNKFDYLLWCSLSISALLYVHYLLLPESTHFADAYHTLASSIYELVNQMWWGILAGILALSILGQIPREFIVSLLGTNTGSRGLLRATAAGLLLDLCSHGILMVGAKLYERGISNGQFMAFLIASPWNSFSLTLILIALIGLKWTLVFILLSLLVAIITGFLFDWLTSKGHIPANPNQTDLPADFKFWPAAKKEWSKAHFTPQALPQALISGLKDSRMVLRWVFFGLLLASLIRAFVSTDHFSTYFGPTLLGLLATLLAATVIEVCSEGSTPIAADLLTRANAPGNSFAFLMTGVSTDYTEIMVVKEATRYWKTTLLLPLLTLPQIIILALIMNLSTST